MSEKGKAEVAKEGEGGMEMAVVVEEEEEEERA